jgi:membrane protein DedA with SNARE-associated domain
VTFSLIGSLVDVITAVLAAIGLTGLFALMTVESFGIPPIPSEVILAFAGFLVAEGTFSFVAAFLVALAGGVVGSFIAYAVGRWWRGHLAGFGVGHLRLRESDLDRMDRWFSRRGEVTVAVCRILPVVRSYISYPAGTARMNPARFGLYTLVGSAPWTFALLYAGYLLGANWLVIERYIQPLDIVFAAAIVATVVYLVLVAGGYVAWGWPPRRGPRRPAASSAPPAPPAAR